MGRSRPVSPSPVTEIEKEDGEVSLSRQQFCRKKIYRRFQTAREDPQELRNFFDVLIDLSVQMICDHCNVTNTVPRRADEEAHEANEVLGKTMIPNILMFKHDIHQWMTTEENVTYSQTVVCGLGDLVRNGPPINDRMLDMINSCLLEIAESLGSATWSSQSCVDESLRAKRHELKRHVTSLRLFVNTKRRQLAHQN